MIGDAGILLPLHTSTADVLHTQLTGSDPHAVILFDGDPWSEPWTDDQRDKLFTTLWDLSTYTFRIRTCNVAAMADYLQKNAYRRSFGWGELDRPFLRKLDVISFEDFSCRNQCGWRGDEEDWQCLHPENDQGNGEDSCRNYACPLATQINDKETMEAAGVASGYDFDDEGYTEDSAWVELHHRPKHAYPGNLELGFAAHSLQEYEERSRAMRPVRWALGPYANLFADIYFDIQDLRMSYWPDHRPEHRGWSPMQPVEYTHGQEKKYVGILSWMRLLGDVREHG